MILHAHAPLELRQQHDTLNPHMSATVTERATTFHKATRMVRWHGNAKTMLYPLNHGNAKAIV
jgi:hypothetical protein